MTFGSEETMALRLCLSRVPLTDFERNLLDEFAFPRTRDEDEFVLVSKLNGIIFSKRMKKLLRIPRIFEEILSGIHDRLEASQASPMSKFDFLRRVPVRRCLQKYGVTPGAGIEDFLDNAVFIGNYSIPAMLHFDMAVLADSVARQTTPGPVINTLSICEREELVKIVNFDFVSAAQKGLEPVFKALGSCDDYEEMIRSREHQPFDANRASFEALRASGMGIIMCIRAHSTGELNMSAQFSKAMASSVMAARVRLAGWVKEYRRG